MRRAVVLLAGMLALTTLPTAWADASGVDEPPSAPDRLLVAYDRGSTASERAEARARTDADLLDRIVRGSSRVGEVELVSIPHHMDRDAAIRRLEADPNVAYAEPDWAVTISDTSNDPSYLDGSLWGMYGDGTSPSATYGSQAGEAWASGNVGDDSIYIGVIDEGIEFTQPDLDENVWSNPFEAPDGVDNDGNGYRDDVRGWDFHNNDASVYDGSGDDHGTHVAGTMAGEGGNGVGVAGVAWRATLIPAKFLGPSGGYISNAVKALAYLTDLKMRHGLNIVATNNSWGGGGYSQSMHDAIIRAAKQNILFIAAAGNDGANNDTTVRYPSGYDTRVGTSTESAATYDSVIAVAAIDRYGALASWSNYGKTRVDIGAPGVSIRSTLPGGYGSYSGTSMATPHVTGGAALKAALGGITGAALRSALLDSGVPTASLLDRTVTGDRLDVSSFGGVVTPLEPDTTPPTVAIVDPVDGEQVSGTIAVTATASDDVGVTSVQFRDGASVIGTDSVAPYSLSWTPTVGSHSLTAVASDGTNTTTSAAVLVDVVAPPTPTSVHVVSISYTPYGGRASNNHLDIRVAVANDVGAPVAGATVRITVRRNGSVYANGTATTSSSGVALFSLKSIPRGTYATDVTSITAGGLTFDGTEPANTYTKA